MNFKTAIELLRETYTEWSEDKAPRLGAALSYYTVFSLVPLLIVVLAIVGLVFDATAARAAIVNQVRSTFGPGTEDMILKMINNANHRGSGIAATVIGIGTSLAGAAGLFGQLQDSLNTIWEVQPKPGQGFLATLKSRFLSFAMVLGTAFLLLVSLALSAALAALGQFLQGIIAMPPWALQGINFIVSFGVITVLFAMIFKILPDVEIQWHDVWIGAALTALLFSIGKFGLGWYLGRESVTSTYAQAASLVIVLLWVYYAAQIMFFGAEFTQVYARKFGSRIVPSPNAVPLTAEARGKQGIPHEEHVEAAVQGKALPGDAARAAPSRDGSGKDGAGKESDTSAPPSSHGPDFDFLIPAAIGFMAVLYVGSKRRSKR
jgi:membrane protein